jgi:hypothetical protein
MVAAGFGAAQPSNASKQSDEQIDDRNSGRM